MKRTAAILSLVAFALVAQAPQSPKIYTYYLFPGDTAYSWLSVTIDPPLVLSKDASGNAHLGLPCLPDDVIPVTTPTASFPVKRFPVNVYLNGLRQALAGDYTQDTTAMKITFVPQAVPGQNETVTIEYRCLGQ